MRIPSRLFTRLTALVAVLFVLAACAPAPAPSPTAPPAKPAATTAPAKAAATAAPAKPAASPAAKAIASPAAKPAASPAAKPAASPAAKPAASPAAKAPQPKPAAKPAAKPSFDQQAVADFYRNKTVRVVVGFSAGGGYDTYSRAIARHLPKYIPGNPTVIVENMTGAGGFIAANHVYNVAPKDGTVIANLNGIYALQQAVGITQGMEFDMSRFQYLSVPVEETRLMLVTKQSGITSFNQLVGSGSREVIIGAVPNDTTETVAQVVQEALNANMKIVTGYRGVADIRIAMEGGEVHGMFNTWQSAKTANFEQIQNGDWLVLAQLSEQPLPDLPVQAPTLNQITTTDDQRELIRYGVIIPHQFTKVYAVAPGVPADRVAALEWAFSQVYEDPEFKAEAEKARLEIGPLGAQETTRLVQQLLNMPQAIKDKLRPILQG